MSLIKHDNKLTLPAFGFRNFSGAACYFNSMLQCFLSCTSVIAAFDRYEELRGRNELCRAVWKTIQLARDSNALVSGMSCVIWEALRRQLRVMRLTTTLGGGMEDAHEGFIKFLEAFDAPEIQELFEHRYRSTFQCSKCNSKWEVENNNNGSETGVFCKFELADFQRDGDLQNMILQREEPSDNDTKCKICSERCEHTRTERFLFTPEVIICWFSKFKPNAKCTGMIYQKWAADSPEKIVIPGHGDSEITYRMMAISEHSGDTDGGHYWAHANRSGERMQRLDDTRVGAPTDVGSTMSSYMVWYHHI
jgi:ubiquitin C-terminal hydrolase